ncbi:MAG: LamG-like jellyroll fold domain-containing protein [Bacteroidota bacterium]
MKNLLLLLCFFTTAWLSAQPTRGLAAYYSFDGCPFPDNQIDDESGNGSNGQTIGDPACGCGVRGDAIFMDGIDDRIVFLGTVNNQFNKKDFSISLYVKPTNYISTMDLISKRVDCDEVNAFGINLQPGSNQVGVTFSENSSKRASVATNLDFDRCWHHIVFIRRGARSLLYLNGTLREVSDAVSRVDINNTVILGISNSPCLSSTETPFQGYIDEIRIYERALESEEVQELYLGPDEILTNDTTIFLGQQVNLVIDEECTKTYSWFPDDGLDNPTVPNPVSSAEETITYLVSISDDEACIATDSVRVTVIDPNDLNCNEIFLPKAFTPNSDGLNDFYGISNPYAIQDLISLEIFDRWGSRVFFTDNPFDTWDGNFKGDPLNPGVLLYRVRFLCDGEEQVDVGSLSIIR